MAVSITRSVVNSVISGTAYQVVVTVTATTDIDDALFLYATGSQLYSNIASIYDLETFPDNLLDAQTGSLGYYRQNTVTRAFSSVDSAKAFIADVDARFKHLAVEYTKFLTGFVGSSSTTITG